MISSGVTVRVTVCVTVTVFVPPQAVSTRSSTNGNNRTMRPVIGITAYAEPSVRWGVWDSPASLVPLAYVHAVQLAGGRPLLVPPSDEGIEETLDALHGLILSGGSDLDPELYGAAPHPETTGIRTDRDRAELALLEGALARDMPVLAICRGSQVLNVARGGDLVQHLPDVAVTKWCASSLPSPPTRSYSNVASNVLAVPVACSSGPWTVSNGSGDSTRIAGVSSSKSERVYRLPRTTTGFSGSNWLSV